MTDCEMSTSNKSMPLNIASCPPTLIFPEFFYHTVSKAPQEFPPHTESLNSGKSAKTDDSYVLLDNNGKLGITQRERSPSTASESGDCLEQRHEQRQFGVYLLEESAHHWDYPATPNPSLSFNETGFYPEYKPRVPIPTPPIEVDDIARIAPESRRKLVEGPKVTVMLDNILEPDIVRNVPKRMLAAFSAYFRQHFIRVHPWTTDSVWIHLSQVDLHTFKYLQAWMEIVCQAKSVSEFPAPNFMQYVEIYQAAKVLGIESAEADVLRWLQNAIRKQRFYFEEIDALVAWIEITDPIMWFLAWKLCQLRAQGKRKKTIDNYLLHERNGGLSGLVRVVGKKLEGIEKWKEDIPEASGPESWARDEDNSGIWRVKCWSRALQWLVETYPYERPPVVYLDPQTLKTTRQEDSRWRSSLACWSNLNIAILVATMLLSLGIVLLQ
ncbi:hypothetical protein AOQ84DRAFT_366869 [Glonium stellatum]|uniref:BTB domain-containing protein n=1 Tax=Glonium stellatum TaxID=574774 RepID=A0A8E2JPS6_9PEZI|nr:hypothetical protein AOQ84DRAFT_366869 [Glonium stellatum]